MDGAGKILYAGFLWKIPTVLPGKSQGTPSGTRWGLCGTPQPRTPCLGVSGYLGCGLSIGRQRRGGHVARPRAATSVPEKSRFTRGLSEESERRTTAAPTAYRKTAAGVPKRHVIYGLRYPRRNHYVISTIRGSIYTSRNILPSTRLISRAPGHLAPGIYLAIRTPGGPTIPVPPVYRCTCGGLTYQRLPPVYQAYCSK